MYEKCLLGKKRIHREMGFFIAGKIRENLNRGKWFRISHSKLGRKIAKAVNPPNQIHRFRKYRVPDERKSPRTIARPKNNIECLFKRPKPATTPKNSHSCSGPRFAIRTAMAAQLVQKRGSKEFMDKKLSI